MDDILILVKAALTTLVMTKYLKLTADDLRHYNFLMNEIKARPAWFGKNPDRKPTQ